MAHAGDAHAGQARALGLGYPQRFHFGQEALALLHVHAKHPQILARIPGQNHAPLQLSPRHGDLVDVQGVAQILQTGVGADVDARKRHTQVKVQGPAQGRQFLVERVVVEAVPHVLGDVEDDGHRRRELVALPAWQGFARLSGRGRRLEGFGQFGPGIVALGQQTDAAQHVAKAPQSSGQGKKLRLGETGDEAKEKDQPPGHEQGLGLVEELLADLGTDVDLGVAGAGDENAGRNGHQQGRDLGDQSVADGQDAVDVQGLAGRHAVLGDADDGPADDVDHGDDHACDAVTLDELHGAVHGAVHLAFLTHALAAGLGLGHVDDPGAHVRVDGHLLARHGVQGETGPDLGHALGAFGDDQKLHDGQNEEDHGTDHEIATQGEVAESEDDLARVRLQEDETSGGDVESHPEQGGEKQHGRKDRKVQGRAYIH